MKFNIITIFPDIFNSYFSKSIVQRAQNRGIIKIDVYNLRDFTQDKHKTVDDTPYGGGAGMVLKVEPIFNCINAIKTRNKKQETRDKKSRIILFSAKGKRYTQKDAQRLSKYNSLILICGRYEGVDERVAQHLADEEISIGDYVLTGGEIPAMIVVDSVSRLLSGVLGNTESLTEESFGMDVRQPADAKNSHEIKNFEKICEYPQYTKPEEFQGWKVPKILLGGNHQKIKDWRKNNSRFSK